MPIPDRKGHRQRCVVQRSFVNLREALRQPSTDDGACRHDAAEGDRPADLPPRGQAGVGNSPTLSGSQERLDRAIDKIDTVFAELVEPPTKLEPLRLTDERASHED